MGKEEESDNKNKKHSEKKKRNQEKKQVEESISRRVINFVKYCCHVRENKDCHLPVECNNVQVTSNLDKSSFSEVGGAKD